MFCLFAGGWCLRNDFVLGGFVSRTNLGMTLVASDSDCARSTLIRDQMNGCYGAHHPNENLQEAELVRSLGEIRYDRLRTAEAEAWMRANPRRFLELTGTRLIEFWFPAREVIPVGTEFAMDRVVPGYTQSWTHRQNRIAWTIGFITLLSLPGIWLMVRRRLPVSILPAYRPDSLSGYVLCGGGGYALPVSGFVALAVAGRICRTRVGGQDERRRCQLAASSR